MHCTKLWKEPRSPKKILWFFWRLRRWLEPPQVLDYLIELNDKQLRLYSWQPWWIIIALVKRQQRQSYVVQARRCVLAYEKSIPLQNNYMLTFTFVKIIIKRTVFVHAGLPTWMALLMNFSKLFYWDRTLWETALSLDQRIKPTIYFIQND
jgi:serine/threonine protein phosphatase 1